MKKFEGKNKDERQKLVFLAIVSFLAVILSIYLTYEHYKPEGSSWCNFSQTINCDIVNKSQYSTIDGFFNWIFPGLYFYFPVPNAILSSLIFLFVFIISVLLLKGKISEFADKFIISVRILMVLSMAYALWLVYIEAFVLLTWCILCLALDILIFSALIISFTLKFKEVIR